MQLSEEEWKKKLTPEQYHLLREKGTETPFSGEYLTNNEPGVYACAACGSEIFKSDHKYDSGSGWPSFYDVISEGKVKIVPDFSHGMQRGEAVCANCGSHLGHLFNDSTPTGMDYCINSAALNFKKKT